MGFFGHTQLSSEVTSGSVLSSLAVSGDHIGCREMNLGWCFGHAITPSPQLSVCLFVLFLLVLGHIWQHSGYSWLYVQKLPGQAWGTIWDARIRTTVLHANTLPSCCLSGPTVSS